MFIWNVFWNVLWCLQRPISWQSSSVGLEWPWGGRGGQFSLGLQPGEPSEQFSKQGHDVNTAKFQKVFSSSPDVHGPKIAAAREARAAPGGRWVECNSSSGFVLNCD